MDTINIYRLYDPLTIQQLQYKLEAAAIACLTAGLGFGNAACSVLDNGFWTIENTLTEPASREIRIKSIEEAVTAVQLFMRDFDIAMQGGKPIRDLNEHEKAFNWNMVHPKYHPPQLREGYVAPKGTDTSKPKFFEKAQYIGGRSMPYLGKYGSTYYYWRLVYGIQVKPSKEEEAVLVEDVEIVIEIWASEVMKGVKYSCLPVKETKETKRFEENIQLASTNHKNSVHYFCDFELSLVLPFSIQIANENIS